MVSINCIEFFFFGTYNRADATCTFHHSHTLVRSLGNVKMNQYGVSFFPYYLHLTTELQVKLLPPALGVGGTPGVSPAPPEPWCCPLGLPMEWCPPCWCTGSPQEAGEGHARVLSNVLYSQSGSGEHLEKELSPALYEVLCESLNYHNNLE